MRVSFLPQLVLELFGDRMRVWPEFLSTHARIVAADATSI
jgi:hypothetical protein